MVRLATRADLDEVLGIYAAARQFMKEQGNPTQWGDDYPPVAMLEEDIARRQLYVTTAEDSLTGVFLFVIGDDPTYRVITEGAWLNAEPYGAIHRVAAAPGSRGLFAACVAYCRNQIDNLRIDTHADNLAMQAAVEKQGFVYTGRITAEDGTPRLAYQWVKPVQASG